MHRITVAKKNVTSSSIHQTSNASTASLTQRLRKLRCNNDELNDENLDYTGITVSNTVTHRGEGNYNSATQNLVVCTDIKKRKQIEDNHIDGTTAIETTPIADASIIHCDICSSSQADDELYCNVIIHERHVTLHICCALYPPTDKGHLKLISWCNCQTQYGRALANELFKNLSVYTPMSATGSSVPNLSCYAIA
jgi:hypothetical protein